MAKTAAATKQEQLLQDRERQLAERLFVKLYDSACGKTLEHLAAKAITDAKVFSKVVHR